VETLVSLDFGNIHGLQVAPGSDGSATVVWGAASVGLVNRLMTATRDPDGSWRVPINVSEGGSTYGVRMAAGSDGTLAAVWEQRIEVSDQVRSVVLAPTSSRVANTAKR
jgi:hypothetical protein